MGWPWDTSRGLQKEEEAARVPQARCWRVLCSQSAAAIRTTSAVAEGVIGSTLGARFWRALHAIAPYMRELCMNQLEYKRRGLQTWRHSNRPAGAVVRSDRPRRSGGPTDHPGPSRGANKGVHAQSQTHAHIRTSVGGRVLTGGSLRAGRAAAQRGALLRRRRPRPPRSSPRSPHRHLHDHRHHPPQPPQPPQPPARHHRHSPPPLPATVTDAITAGPEPPSLTPTSDRRQHHHRRLPLRRRRRPPTTRRRQAQPPRYVGRRAANGVRRVCAARAPRCAA